MGFHDPQNLNAIDEIELKTGKTIQVVLCSKELLKNVIQSSYSIEIVDESDNEEENNSSAIIELVEKIIEEAIESDASDIHIQPSEFELTLGIESMAFCSPSWCFRIPGLVQSIQD